MFRFEFWICIPLSLPSNFFLEHLRRVGIVIDRPFHFLGQGRGGKTCTRIKFMRIKFIGSMVHLYRPAMRSFSCDSSTQSHMYEWTLNYFSNELLHGMLKSLLFIKIIYLMYSFSPFLVVRGRKIYPSKFKN